MDSAGRPSRRAMIGRRSLLAKPRGRSRNMHRAASRAWARGSPRRRPAIRVPALVVRGWLIWRSAAWPATGSWLSLSAASSRRLAAKPMARRVGRLVSRLPMPKSTAGVVDGGFGPQRPSFLVVLLDLRMLVVNVQGRDHPVGDDPGAEPARCRPRAGADDAPAEDQVDLVGAADVEVVAGSLLEEDPPGDR